MAYRHISNLYKNKDILQFKRCIAMEKVHGSSANISYRADQDKLNFFAGGCKHQSFLKVFDQEDLLEKFRENARLHADVNRVTIFGEAYGGKMQGMRATYGPDLKFVAFEVRADNWWFNVRQADRFVTETMGLEFVHYVEIDTTEEAINAEMMADSVQAIRNGMGEGHMREGVVLRPVIEFIHQNGGRVICKHKRPEFAERANTPKFTDPEKLKILSDAKEVAEEWVNSQRLAHVLDKIPGAQIEDSNKVVTAMVEDIYREAKGEIVESREVKRAIGKETMRYFKAFLLNSCFEN